LPLADSHNSRRRGIPAVGDVERFFGGGRGDAVGSAPYTDGMIDEAMTCKCGASATFSAEGVCHKCGHPVVDAMTGERRRAVLTAHEVKSQSRAREYRKDPKHLAVGHGYLPPLGGDGRAR
jgi:hypothetical protein